VNRENWALIADAAGTVIAIAAGIWLPDYRELVAACWLLAQTVVSVVFVEVRSQRREAALRAQIQSLMGR